MVALFSRFWRDRSGISLTEGLIAFPVIFLTICAFIEIGVSVYRFNQMTKAVQMGARLAAVSDPLTSLSPIVATYGTARAGEPVPDNNAKVVCGAGASACDAARLTRLVGGTNPSCDAAAETGVLGMCDIYPPIRNSHVRVTYQSTGLGYIGRPFNPVVSVRVELIGGPPVGFFLLPAALRAAGRTGTSGVPNSLLLPTLAVTMTSEDLSTPPLGIASGSP